MDKAYILGYIIGFISAAILFVIALALYERQCRLFKKQQENLQIELNKALSKVMAVDYEKLAIVEARANAEAAAAWTKIAMTNDYEDIQEPFEIPVRKVEDAN